MRNQLRFTKASITALKPTGKDYFVWDIALPGFGVRVQPSGHKMFCVRYRTESGTQRKMNVGRTDVLHPDQARDKARALLARVAAGDDPAAQRRETREGMTVADLGDAYTEYCVNRIKPLTKALYKDLWETINDALGRKKVADLSAGDVVGFHTTRGATYPISANRCIALLRAAMNYAETRGWRAKYTNPCAAVVAFPETPKERVLSTDEVSRLWEAIEAYDKSEAATSVRLCLKLLMLTGLRRNEWQKGRVAWLNLDAGTYSLPSSASKGGARVVHLSAAVVALLRDTLRSRNEQSEFICPGRLHGRALDSIEVHWQRIRASVGLRDVRLHDLRHTVGSLGHQAGLSQKQIQKLLGHKSARTSDRYIHSYDSAAQAAADVAASAIMGNVGK